MFTGYKENLSEIYFVLIYFIFEERKAFVIKNIYMKSILEVMQKLSASVNVFRGYSNKAHSLRCFWFLDGVSINLQLKTSKAL